jgi:hypothetical protein
MGRSPGLGSSFPQMEGFHNASIKAKLTARKIISAGHH